MTVQRYSLVSHDWVNLEYIINDLTRRVVGQVVNPTSSPTFGDVTVTDDLSVGGDLDITGSLTLSDLTASRLAATDGDKILSSVTDLTSWIAGTENQITVADDEDGSVTLSTPQDIATSSDVEFQSLLIDQNTDAIGLNIDSEATTLENYGLQCITGAGAGAAYFACGDGNNGAFYCGLPNNVGLSANFVFARNLTAASTDSSVVYIVQDHADDDRPCLELKQDGSGPALLVAEGGSMVITGGITIDTNLTLPDDGWIGSTTTPQSLQVEADGDVVFIGAIDVPSDIVCGGHVLFDLDNGHIGYLDNSPIITFNNADNQAEVTGDLTVSGLSASRLIAADGSNKLISSDLVDWVAGTENQTIVTDDTDGTITLSLPQDIHPEASPTFAGMNLTGYLDITEIVESDPPSDNHLRIYAIEDIDFTALEIIDPIGQTYRICQDSFRIAKNTSGAEIAAGKAVYYTGSTGNKPTFALAQSNSEATMPCIGMTVDVISDDGYGHLMIVGVLKNVKTDYDGWTEGDDLYVDPDTAGELTNAKPTHPNLAQWVGSIEVVHASQGRILVGIRAMTGREDGTNQNSFTIGDQSAGAKSLIFDNGFLGTLSWTPTEARAITLPDNTGTIALTSDLNVVNWDTAYGWGNHADAGYLTDITDESIGDLSDVDLTDIDDGKILQYNSGTGKWECEDNSGGTSDHAALSHLAFADSGHTGFQAAGDILDDLNTLGVSGSDGQFIVATGAGALAWESGDTARISLGLGTTDSPTFAGCTIAGQLYVYDTNYNVVRFNRTGRTTNDMWPCSELVATKTSAPGDGFGTGFMYSISNNGATPTWLGKVGFVRDGADTSGAFVVETHYSASFTERFRIDVNGGVYAPYIKTGTDQVDAGAAAGEIWADSDDEYRLKLGV